MIIKPAIRMNIAMNAHPLGIERVIQQEIERISLKSKWDGPKNALIIGGSTGYGLGTRLALTYGANTNTVNVSYEAPPLPDQNRTGSAGYWNNTFFQNEARKHDKIAKDFLGDAFSNEMKEKIIEFYKSENKQIDLLVYSLAAPKRIDPNTKEVYNSVLKVIGEPLTGFSIDIASQSLVNKSIEAALPHEIDATVKVMGGEDWELWINALKDANLLAPNFKTVAYTYIGPEATERIYRGGSIGKAKDHLEQTSFKLSETLAPLGGEAIVASCKAVVTRASAVIPIFPVYGAILFKVMKERKVHETTNEQIERFLVDMLYGNKRISDTNGRLRPDNLEMIPEIQTEVANILKTATPENMNQISDISGFCKEFYELNGFEIDSIDYDEDIDLKALAAKYVLE